MPFPDLIASTGNVNLRTVRLIEARLSLVVNLAFDEAGERVRIDVRRVQVDPETNLDR